MARSLIASGVSEASFGFGGAAEGEDAWFVGDAAGEVESAAVVAEKGMRRRRARRSWRDGRMSRSEGGIGGFMGFDVDVDVDADVGGGGGGGTVEEEKDGGGDVSVGMVFGQL